MVKQRNPNVGMYVRLSKEDFRQGESVSIENQKAILLKYIVEQAWNLVDIYADDGYSGGNFERPGFQRLMEDVRRGTVNLILVKDMSRFGRDYIEVGRYIEHILPKLGCRLIALHDGMDTDSDASTDFIPFKNLFNDFYLRDLSRKVKGSQRAMAEKGKFGGSYAPYGYRLADDEKRTLLIDDTAAEIVRRIFEMRKNGCGTRKIARALNEEGIPSPSEYRGIPCGRAVGSAVPVAWNDAGLRKILSNEAYIGNMVQHKTESMSHKTKLRRGVPEAQHIRITNTHEAIIDTDTWNVCQNVIHAARRTRSAKDETQHLFSGLMVCADCGYAMRTAPKTRADGSLYIRYICGRYQSCGKSACGSHSIREDTLCEIVRRDIVGHISVAPVSDDVLRASLSRKLEQASARQNAAERNRMNSLQKRLEELNVILRNLYEDKALGRIPEASYFAMAEQYQAELREKTAQLDRLQKALEQTINAQNALTSFLPVAKRIASAEVLTREMLLALIERIEIGNGSVQAMTGREITIYYKNVGKLEQGL
jgi:DNA invertase Pin-like site-specific DNA recombinase/chaperonin cofactor prefoldin